MDVSIYYLLSSFAAFDVFKGIFGITSEQGKPLVGTRRPQSSYLEGLKKRINTVLVLDSTRPVTPTVLVGVNIVFPLEKWPFWWIYRSKLMEYHQNIFMGCFRTIFGWF